MSERLTHSDVFGGILTNSEIHHFGGAHTGTEVAYSGEPIDRLFEIENMCYDQLGREVISIARLRELAEAEREGRVVVLPCKVGDTVFVLTADSLDGYEETKINRIVIKKNKIFLNADCKNDDWGSAAWELSPHDFGKKVFLTQAEAATEPKGDAT